MTAYIANHQKKSRIFAKREQQLIRAIIGNEPVEKLVAIAENVRSAKMSVFKCRFARLTTHQPHTFSPEELAIKDKKIRVWLEMSATDIVDRYRAIKS